MTEEVIPESLTAVKLGSRVIISTVHGSKGREYDRVWVIDDDLQEAAKSYDLDEKKVAYVALSRARKATYLQHLPETGLCRDMEEDRCYRKNSRSSKRPKAKTVKKRLTHIELVNSKDLSPEVQLTDMSLQKIAISGELDGMAVRLCVPADASGSETISYDIMTDDGIFLGKTSRSFISYYLRCYENVCKDTPRYLPEAFDELYIDRIVTFVGRVGVAPPSARKFGDYAIWYGFTLGGFAHIDDSQGH